ncbi:MAG TPA: hypothetical protein VFC65_16920 [Prolixibacteraceae bacterium]|nr:hypothetical protein [Prolixibacteraceae bacterium]
MKRTVLFLCLIVLMFGQTSLGAVSQMTNPLDSVYLFSYSTEKSAGHNGLHFARSTDHENWSSIGPEFLFLFSDYRRWGKEKRLVTPFLIQAKDGMWHGVWSLNEYDGTFAHAASSELIHWTPQS